MSRQRRPRTTRRWRPAILGVVVGAGVLAGCGGPASNGEARKAAAQIVADASRATDSAQSVRVSGQGSINGLAVQLNVVAGPGRGGGSVVIGGSTVQMVLNRQQFYLKADPGLIQQLTGSPETEAKGANTWLQLSSSASIVSTLPPLLDITKLPASTVNFAGAPARRRVTTFRGHPAIPVVDSQAGDTVYVAATGKPYILGIKGAPRSAGTTLAFTDYDRAPIPAPPAVSTRLAPPGG